MKNVLQLENVAKRFPIVGSKKVVQAVNNVTLDLAPGQTLALVGESGSGKTTLGRLIAGLVELSDGTIRFQGEDVRGLRRKDGLSLGGRIQFVFQEPAEQLDPRRTIGDSVSEPLLAQKVDAAERHRRARAALERVALPATMANLLPGQLSGGQLQRVGIARALVTSPLLIILDEPTSALDPTARAEIIALLKDIQKSQNTAYLFISHDLSTVRFLSDRVAVLYLGMVVEEGATADVFDRPKHPYTQALMGAALWPHPHLVPTSNVKLSGEIPSPINLPTGCFLASRCPFVQPECRASVPPRELIGDDYTVRCIRHKDLPRGDESNSLYQQFQVEAERILSVGAQTTHAAE